MARIELSNIGGGGTTLSLTTTGTSGASTLAGSVLNIPVYQGQLTLTTTGTSGAATLSGDVLNIPQYSGGGGTPAGSTGQIQYNNAGAFGASANLAWDNSNVRLNIGAPSAPTGRLNIKGAGATTTVGLSITNNSNASIVQSLDNGNVGFGQSSPLGTVHIKSVSNTSGAGIILESPEATLTGERGLSMYVTGNGQTTAGANNANFSFIVGGPGTTSVSQGPFFQLFGNNYSRFSGYKGAIYFYAGQVTSPSTGDGIISFVSTSSYIDFSTGVTSTLSRVRIINNGNVILQNGGTFTDGGYKLDVLSASSTHGARVRAPNASSGTNALLVQNTTVSDLYKIEADGKISYLATNTAAGTTGPQTINRPSGTVNFGIGAGSLVVTNSLCTTASLVFAEVRTNDATAQIKNVVPAAGSFTINLNAAATAETSVGFFIIN